MKPNILQKLVSPQYCYSCGKYGQILCDRCKDRLHGVLPQCYVCRRLSNNYTTHPKCNELLRAVFIAYEYTTPLQKLILELKYNGAYKNLLHLKLDIIKRISRFISTIQYQNPNHQIVLIPIPLHWQKKIKRGFNQTEIICKMFPSELLVKKLLTKPKSSNSQASKNRDGRLHSQLLFKVNNAVILNPNEIPLIIDDVLTTGSTLQHAANAIKKAYPTKNIYGFTLFRPQYRGKADIMSS